MVSRLTENPVMHLAKREGGPKAALPYVAAAGRRMVGDFAKPGEVLRGPKPKALFRRVDERH
jgi:hypothetical protein